MLSLEIVKYKNGILIKYLPTGAMVNEFVPEQTANQDWVWVAGIDLIREITLNGEELNFNTSWSQEYCVALEDPITLERGIWQQLPKKPTSWLKISKESSSYKYLNRWSDSSIPTNLCPYMRRVVMFMLLHIFLGVVAGIAAIGVIMVPIAIGFGLTFGSDLAIFTIIIGCACWAMGIIAAVGFGGYTVIDKVAPSLNDKISECNLKQRITGSLVWQWLKAKHDKICPVIEFTE